MKKRISIETHKLLTKMVELAKEENPVQGKFNFLYFNFPKNGLTEKEGVLNCGTTGCIAGGYLPRLDKRFHFSNIGEFSDGDRPFGSGDLYYELGHDVFYALFYPHYQHILDRELTNLNSDAIKEDVIANAEYILANNLHYDETL
jgi:hypothetical protein